MVLIFSGTFGNLRDYTISENFGYGRTCKVLKASGRKVESAQQFAQILEWPSLTPNELADLEKVLLRDKEPDKSSINDLAERMAFRSQGLKPDSTVPVPESTEWFIWKYAPERYRPAHISKVE